MKELREELKELRKLLKLKLRVILNTGSTIEQGVVIKGGMKFDREYRECASICFMNEEDMNILAVRDGDNIKLKTDVGEIVLSVVGGDIQRGTVFVPRGPWINLVIDSTTFGTGSPFYKGMDAEIMPTDEDVMDLNQIIGIYDKK